MLQTLRDLCVRWAGAAVLLAAAVSPSLAQGLTVAADSSLGEAMGAVARGFEAGHKGVSVKLLLGASGVLLEQVAQGVPADVLASADAETVALGVQRRLLVADLRGAFASNHLVLVVPASLSLPVKRLSDLARPEVVRIAMGREASVPAGRYAREAINAQRLWPSVQRKVVIAADLREVLDLVAGGDVEAGFVFATDVAAVAGRVRVVETLATTTPVRHLANVTAGSKNPALAQEFIAYLRSEPARALLKGLGFGVP
ncbi:MAG TPA: molybdate ABC transporter substrate-binding protein [Ideonella sp.]|nr:molybdate ABC transporter substrate-binding protein [Ideonella sp.]